MARASSRVTDATLAAAHEALRSCTLCPRDCRADRTKGKHTAFCRLGSEAWVYRELLSLGEEPAISPTWLIDLGGCSMRCLHCSEWDHVVQPQRPPGLLLTPEWFVARLQHRVAQGARTVSFAGGDPTVSVVAVLDALAHVPDVDWLPAVWNCNGWLSPHVREWLAPVVDTWLVDVKFGNPACAARIAGVDGERYQEGVRETLAFARERGLMLRHLALPGHLDCCTRPVLAWLERDFAGVPLNVMDHYLPMGPARSVTLPRAPELGRILRPAELVSLAAAQRVR